ncbi:hypothetical protein CVT26_000928, partial [Gymnopilus dilepis]
EATLNHTPADADIEQFTEQGSVVKLLLYSCVIPPMDMAISAGHMRSWTHVHRVDRQPMFAGYHDHADIYLLLKIPHVRPTIRLLRPQESNMSWTGTRGGSRPSCVETPDSLDCAHSIQKVAALYVLNLANSVLLAIFMYQSLTISFGNFEALDDITWLNDIINEGAISALVQFFFAWRIWCLTRNVLCFILITVPATVGGVSAFITTGIVSQQPFFSRLRRGTVCAFDYSLGRLPIFVQVFDVIWLGSGVAADILITVLLVHFLVSRHDFQPTVADIHTPSETINLGSRDPTCHHPDRHISLTFTLCKLYSVSLMSSLNARRSWEHSLRPPGLEGESLGTHISSGGDLVFQQSKIDAKMTPIQFAVPLEVQTETDSYHLSDA